MKKALLSLSLLYFPLNGSLVSALSNDEINYISAGVGAVGGLFIGSGLTTPSAQEMIIGSIVLGGGYLASEEYGKKRSIGEDFAREVIPAFGQAVENRIEWGIKGALVGAFFGAIAGILSREEKEERNERFNDQIGRSLLTRARE